jgi:hypothetical protein
MAYEISPYAIKITLVAGASLASDQYKFVKLDSSGQAVLCSGATDRPIGVLQNNPASGEEAEVLVAGGTKVKAGGTVSEGTILKTNATGLAAALTVGTDTTHYIVGTSLVDGVSGDVISAVINCASAARGA